MKPSACGPVSAGMAHAIGSFMKRCHQCGNSYDKCFEVTIDHESYTFDCFECAIHSLAPICACCGCRILGHGVEGEGAIYCCAYCARAEGVEGLVDNVDNVNNVNNVDKGSLVG